ncbi:MAG: CdaR family protein [Desulfovibrionaceae bacterium]|nr:CdaR family protein [Desulfovibrionaceae bacterium]
MTFPDIKCNWQMLLLSFVLASGLWYAVTVRDRLGVQAEVNLTYRGMPENLMVREGMLKNFTVQLRGPRELIKNLDTKMLTYSVDLSRLRPGTNVIALSTPFTKAESRALDVVELVPNQLVLEAEDVVEYLVPLEVRFNTPALAQALKAENLHASPDSVSIRGPESVIRKIQSLKLDVPLEPAAMGEYQLLLPVSTPAQVTATPGAVLVRYSIAGARVSLALERTPFLDAKNPQQYRITPPKTALTVELPTGLKDNKSYLEKIRVVISAKDLPLSGSGEVRPFVELPEGARLMGISPAKLSVTKNGK